jgi:hypothetical protein
MLEGLVDCLSFAFNCTAISKPLHALIAAGQTFRPGTFRTRQAVECPSTSDENSSDSASHRERHLVSFVYNNIREFVRFSSVIRLCVLSYNVECGQIKVTA